MACLRKRELKRKQTPAEQEFKNILASLGISFGFQKIIYTKKGFFIIDFLIENKISLDGQKKRKVIIEIDGGYHNHNYDTWRTRRVVESTKVYRKCTWFRFTNEEVFNGYAKKEVRRIFKKVIKRLRKKTKKPIHSFKKNFPN